MSDKFIVKDATDDIVIGGFGNLKGNLGLLKYNYEEIEQKMEENNNKEDDIRLVNSLLDSLRDLQQENQELKNNWAAIKEYCLNEQIPEEYDEYNSYIEFSNNAYEKVLNKMQEMESNNANTTN